MEVPPDEARLRAVEALGPLPPRPRPEVDFRPEEAQKHVSAAALSHFPRARPEGDLALDLGCGNGGHRPLLERCGFAYVGVDAAHRGAPLLADAHALPFQDASFGFATAFQVLEHVYHPPVALAELHRVLRPGAAFVGSVAFLEAFHGDSFFHHTHRGTAQALLSAQFEVEALGYEGAVAPMSLRKHLFYSLPRGLGWASGAMLWPVGAASRAYWGIGALARRNPSLQHVRRRNLAGSFAFVARRPAA